MWRKGNSIRRANENYRNIGSADVNDVAEFQSLFDIILEIDDDCIEEWHVFEVMAGFGQRGSPVHKNACIAQLLQMQARSVAIDKDDLAVHCLTLIAAQ